MRHQHLFGRIFLATAAWAVLAITAAAQAPARPASLDEVLKRLATFDGGIESAPVWALRDYVTAQKTPAARAECQAKLLQFLKTPATPSAKLAVAKHLRLITDDSAVPALQALLRDPGTADIALYVLQPLAGAAADKALLQALGTTTGATRLEVIAALGRRRTAEAVPALKPLLQQPALAAAAATALGSIGNDAGGQALEAAYAGATPELKPVVAGGLLHCAETSLASKNDAAALRIYERLAADTAAPRAVRKAAALGRISASGTRARAVLMELLGSSDALLQEAALAKVKDVVAPTDIASVSQAMARLPEAGQVQLLAILAGYPPEAVRATVLQAAKSPAAPVRLAALKALEATGDATTLPYLLETASKTRGAEQTAARAAIGMLKGRAVDEAIVAQLGASPAPETQGELLLAVADRRIFSAKPLVSAALASPLPAVRTQGLKALKVIGTPSDVATVLDLLVKSEEGPERAEAESAAAALAQKTLKADARAAVIKTRLGDEKDAQARVRLMALLPLIGDPSTLPILRKALEDKDADVYDAAVRALTSWPTSAARDEVLRLARDSRNETHRLLAIAGLVRLVGVDRHREPAAAVADLRSAAAFSWRPEEQRLVLGALVQFPCPEALDLATGFLRDPTVKPEAEAAVEKIKAKLK